MELVLPRVIKSLITGDVQAVADGNVGENAGIDGRLDIEMSLRPAQSDFFPSFEKIFVTILPGGPLSIWLLRILLAKLDKWQKKLKMDDRALRMVGYFSHRVSREWPFWCQ